MLALMAYRQRAITNSLYSRSKHSPCSVLPRTWGHMMQRPDAGIRAEGFGERRQCGGRTFAIVSSDEMICGPKRTKPPKPRFRRDQFRAAQP